MNTLVLLVFGGSQECVRHMICRSEEPGHSSVAVPSSPICSGRLVVVLAISSECQTGGEEWLIHSQILTVRSRCHNPRVLSSPHFRVPSTCFLPDEQTPLSPSIISATHTRSATLKPIHTASETPSCHPHQTITMDTRKMPPNPDLARLYKLVKLHPLPCPPHPLPIQATSVLFGVCNGW